MMDVALDFFRGQSHPYDKGRLLSLLVFFSFPMTRTERSTWTTCCMRPFPFILSFLPCDTVGQERRTNGAVQPLSSAACRQRSDTLVYMVHCMYPVQHLNAVPRYSLYSCSVRIRYAFTKGGAGRSREEAGWRWHDPRKPQGSSNNNIRIMSFGGGGGGCHWRVTGHCELACTEYASVQCMCFTVGGEKSRSVAAAETQSLGAVSLQDAIPHSLPWYHASAIIEARTPKNEAHALDHGRPVVGGRLRVCVCVCVCDVCIYYSRVFIRRRMYGYVHMSL